MGGGTSCGGRDPKNCTTSKEETKKKISESSPSLPHWIGSPKFFSKTCKFSIILYSTLRFSGGGHFRKACRSRKKESKHSEITCKQSEPVRTISKIQKRREFVRALCYELCPRWSVSNFQIQIGFWPKLGRTWTGTADTGESARDKDGQRIERNWVFLRFEWWT